MSKLIELPGGPYVRADSIVEVTQPEKIDENHWVFHVIYNRNVSETVNFCANVIGDGTGVYQTHYKFISNINNSSK